MLLRFELFYSCFIKEIMVFKWMVKGVVIFFFLMVCLIILKVCLVYKLIGI